ncbi:hypothetical protein Tco_0902686 [Tanacetum coccineum]
MSTSATSIRKRRVIPTHCQCNMPLVRRVAWTDTNPCRRFLKLPVDFNRKWGRLFAKSFYSGYDPELTKPMYKTLMFEIYTYFRILRKTCYTIKAQIGGLLKMQLEICNELEVYQHDNRIRLENIVGSYKSTGSKESLRMRLGRGGRFVISVYCLALFMWEFLVSGDDTHSALPWTSVIRFCLPPRVFFCISVVEASTGSKFFTLAFLLAAFIEALKNSVVAFLAGLPLFSLQVLRESLSCKVQYQFGLSKFLLKSGSENSFAYAFPCFSIFFLHFCLHISLIAKPFSSSALKVSS